MGDRHALGHTGWVVAAVAAAVCLLTIVFLALSLYFCLQITLLLGWVLPLSTQWLSQPFYLVPCDLFVWSVNK